MKDQYVEPVKLHEDEIFIPILGYENYYAVSNYGRVFSCMINKGRRGRCLVPIKGKNGYMYVNLCKKDYSKKIHAIHRLVAIAFIPNRKQKECVHHKNSIRHDNNSLNLEWVTYQENSTNAKLSGRIPNGSDRYNAVLTEKDIPKIRRLYRSGNLNKTEIASIFKVNRGTIRAVLNGKTWTQVQEKTI